ATVGGEILRDQADLAGALLDELMDLLYDRVHGATALRPPELRDDAEGARTVTALGDLDERLVPATAQAPRSRVIVEIGTLAERRDGVAFRSAAEHLREPEHVGGAEEVIDLGQLRREIFGVALAQAARDDEPALAIAATLHFRQLQDRVHRLDLGGFDEATGVDDEHVGVLGRVDELVAFALHDAQHDLRIHLVLGTTEGHEKDLLTGRGGRHGSHDGTRRFATSARRAPPRGDPGPPEPHAHAAR